MKRNVRFGRWETTRRLGYGGNGEVWEVRSDDDPLCAIKLLDLRKRGRRYRLARFRDEIRFLTEHAGRQGVLPLIDSRLSDDPAKVSWYVMPKATPIRDALGDDPEPKEVVGAVAAIAETLAALAAEGIGHRDVKPDNLFKLDDQWVIGDFGLVTYPEKEPLTVHGKKLGPTEYLAPEMREDADHALAEAADVWALSKTLWVLLVGASFPLPGPHRPTDPAYALRDRISFTRAGELDLLMERATRIDPRARESMREFARELRACLAPLPEAVCSASLQELQDRITTLTAATYQQMEDSQERRRRANMAFDELKAVLSDGYHALAQRLVYFRSYYHGGITDAMSVPGPGGGAYAQYTWGGQFVSPGGRPSTVVTIAVAMRLMKKNEPAEIAGLLRVERRHNDLVDAHDVWRAAYTAPIGSAQQVQTIAEIRAGFFSGFDETLRRVAQTLGETE